MKKYSISIIFPPNSTNQNFRSLNLGENLEFSPETNGRKFGIHRHQTFSGEASARSSSRSADEISPPSPATRRHLGSFCVGNNPHRVFHYNDACQRLLHQFSRWLHFSISWKVIVSASLWKSTVRSFHVQVSSYHALLKVIL